MDVPSELAVLDQWVCWKMVTRKGKTTKQPFTTKGRPASVTDSTDWCTLEEALRAVDVVGFDGVGFVFTADDPYAGIDFDHCIDEAGNVHPSVLQFVDALPTYWEISPSGTGLHGIFRGNIGQGRRAAGDWGGNIEAYDQGRYFTVTGRVFDGHRDIQDVILPDEVILYGEDRRIINNCRRNAKNFIALFDEGDMSEYGDDQSKADIALANSLAARTEDPKQIERIMRQSALAREKWDHPDTGSIWLYRRCIEPAIRDTKKKALTGDFEADVAYQIYTLKVRDEARLRLNAEVYEQRAFPYPAPGWSLADELALPPRDVVWRVQDLQQVHQNIVLIAGYKLGKTTLSLNLVRSLVDGTPFMGMYEVTPVEGNIGVINYELDREYFYDFCREMKIQHPEKIKPVHARGHGTIPFWLPAAQDSLVEYLEREECRYLVLDPTAQAWDTLLESEGDNIRAAQFTRAIDTVKQRAGIEEAFLTHHTSRATQDQGRGPSALEGWYDAGWFLQGERDALQFKAMGRGGIDVPLMPVAYHEDKAHTFLPDDRDKKAEVQERKDAKRTALETLREKGSMSQSALAKELKDRGVGVSANRIKKLLADWCGSMDNNMAVRTETVHGRAQRTYYLKGEEGHE